jgi:hypothetical protein
MAGVSNSFAQRIIAFSDSCIPAASPKLAAGLKAFGMSQKLLVEFESQQDSK